MRPWLSQGMRSRGGFSMVELTTALFVLAVGMMGTLQMYNIGTDKMRTMRESEIAMRAVDAEVEALRALPFAQLTDRTNAAFVSTPAGIENLVNATTTVSVRPHSQAQLKLKEVTATFRWTGENGRTLHKSATTWIADKGAE